MFPAPPRSAQIDSHRAVKSSHECTDLRIDSTEFIMHEIDPSHNQWIPSTGLNPGQTYEMERYLL